MENTTNGALSPIINGDNAQIFYANQISIKEVNHPMVDLSKIEYFNWNKEASQTMYREYEGKIYSCSYQNHLFNGDSTGKFRSENQNDCLFHSFEDVKVCVETKEELDSESKKSWNYKYSADLLIRLASTFYDYECPNCKVQVKGDKKEFEEWDIENIFEFVKSNGAKVINARDKYFLKWNDLVFHFHKDDPIHKGKVIILGECKAVGKYPYTDTQMGVYGYSVEMSPEKFLSIHQNIPSIVDTLKKIECHQILQGNTSL